MGYINLQGWIVHNRKCKTLNMEFFRLNFPDTEKFDKVSLDHDNCNDNNES